MPDMARRPDPRERVLGPYAHHGGWRVIVVGANGRRRYFFFEERAAADEYKAIVERKIATIIHTTETAREDFVKAMKARRLSDRTVEGYEWAIKTLWPTAKPMRALTRANCAERYHELVGTLSVDSHRNALKMGKTFLRWCVEKGWLAENPLEGVAGVGKRKKGKPQLRLDEARKFYEHALARANAGDAGAVAALMALLLTMRSEVEILAAVARDLDDGGRLLWIDESKSDAGRRVEVVPEELRPALLALAAGKEPEERLFRRADRKWLWDEVARLCEEAGVPRVPPHALRGQHATLAKQQGATSLLVAAALGHASPRVTEDHYVDHEATKASERERTLTLLKGGKAG